ncbi:hypothetical protein O1R50_18635 [Glycomyces luteolus]|uniref:Uncharacterized protein n=1 Tax=Glycomyces luteolus TaxID=2670330 RepID=A0A9X3PCK3_9ACTN|nr:hypothetical protein [Glycomyces luteolus]MDA1361651.1 hypothetical protein [Glycomyces luteolus]
MGRDSVQAKRDVHITNIHLPSSEAVADLRDMFGASTNRESFEVEVEDLVAPPGTEEHFEALDEEFVLVLASTGQTGLSTAVKQRCKAFGARLGLPARMLQSTSVDELKQELEGFEAPTVLVLDTSQNPGLEEQLPTAADYLRTILKKLDCRLVIAVELEFRIEFQRHFPKSVFDLARADPDRVFTHHFDRADAEFAEILESEYFSDTLSTAWPPLVRLMASILSHAPADLTLQEFQEQLKRRVEDASASIRDLLENKLDAQGKAVLISASALERMSTRSIALAAEDFLRYSKDEGTPVEVLGEYGILQKLELIRQEFYIEGSNFKHPDLGDEVLLHVWEQYPAWHMPLRNWLVRLLLEPDYLEWTNLTRLPRRLVKLASVAEDGSMLTGQVEVMTVSRSPVIRSLASAVLLGGALDDTIGPSVRGRIYDWSRGSSFERQVAALEACADEDYLVRFPRNALFRLRQLARSEHDGVAEAAFEAIIASSARIHLGDLLVHFRHWLFGADQNEISMIPRLLDRICVREDVIESLRQDPWPVIGDPAGLTASFWRLVLTIADPASVRLAVRAWLSAAAELSPADGERMVALVVKAAADDYGSIGQIAQASKSLTLDGAGLSERTRELSRQMLSHMFEIEVPLP